MMMGMRRLLLMMMMLMLLLLLMMLMLLLMMMMLMLLLLMMMLMLLLLMTMLMLLLMLMMLMLLLLMMMGMLLLLLLLLMMMMMTGMLLLLLGLQMLQRDPSVLVESVKNALTLPTASVAAHTGGETCLRPSRYPLSCTGLCYAARGACVVLTWAMLPGGAMCGTDYAIVLGGACGTDLGYGARVPVREGATAAAER
eukprot:1446800-Rhodomonas_salina.1